MLRWRLLLGTFSIAVLAGLVWMDTFTRPAGAWLFPTAVVLGLAATGELLSMLRELQMRPPAWLICVGNLLVMLAAWLPLVLLGRWQNGLCQCEPQQATLLAALSWPLLATAVVLGACFLVEMARYHQPGNATANLAGGALALVYIGISFGLLIQLRMLWGLGALVAMVAVVKMADTGAYVFGHLIGRHKLAPVISPNKTVEGLVGHILAAGVTGWLAFAYLVPLLPAEGDTSAAAVAGSAGGWRGVLFGLVVGVAGLGGDLAESLLKRDCRRKDSSRWLPGFGGVLDMLDSLLLAAPVAWLCWGLAIVG